MEIEKIISFIKQGRTDFIFHLMRKPNWKKVLHEDQIKPLQWLVYYNDTTGLRAVLEKGADINARTVSGLATGAFMRDVRTKGESINLPKFER